MARIASQSQAGYYPTPPEEMELICKKLVIEKPNELYNILDPCCGKGDALLQISDHLKSQGAETETYGCELEQSRSNEAKKILGKVVTGGYEDLRATNKVFSLLWLNPPYDWHSGIRTEQIFLNNLTAPGRYLQTGGVMGFCIPHIALSHCSRLLSFRFENLKVYRFTDKNYPVFKQIVVFGTRREGRADSEEIKSTRDWLEQLSPDQVPILDEDDWTIKVPVSSGPVKLFRGYALNPEEIAQEIETSPVWEVVSNAYLAPEISSVEMPRPLLSLSAAHIATAIAAGAINGRMGNHYRKGLTRKLINKEIIPDDDNEKETIVETEKHISVIRVFTPEGVFDLE